MRAASAALVVAFALLWGTNPALAGWSAPRLITSKAYTRGVGVAVDARGDVASAWAVAPCEFGCVPSAFPAFKRTVHIVVRLANGRVIARQLWSSAEAEVAGQVSVAIAHGEVTVAWVPETLEQRRTHSPLPIEVAYGPILGRWRPAQAVGDWHDNAPALRWPRLAAAPDGEVLLAFDDDSPAIDAPAAAWRKPGHRFGAPRRLFASANVQLTVPNQFGPIPMFDAHGNAYVWGKCDGIVLSAPARSHRFGRPLIVAPSPVRSFTLSLSGPGRGIAAWVHARCEISEPEIGQPPGPVRASILRAGVFGKPLAVTSPTVQTYGADGVALAGGGGTVSWWAPRPLAPTPFSVQVGADGTLGPVLSGAQLPGGLVPATSDGGGDEFLSTGPYEFPGLGSHELPSLGCVVRPVGGGTEEPAPSPSGSLAAASPLGRAFALVWSKTPSVLALSVWRP